MIILRCVVLLLRLIDKISNGLEYFGFKLFRISRESVLKGFPPEIHDEVNQPDIKMLFDKTMEAMEKDREMSFLPRFQLREMFRLQLRCRLLLRKVLKEKPEILEIPVENPIFIIGVPRSGTTFLSWFLSCDEQFRSPMMWEQLENCPPGPVKDFTKDPRYIRCVQANEFRKALVGEQTYVAHPSQADKPEECSVLLLRSFYNVFLHFPLQCMDEYNHIMNHIGNTEDIRHIYRHYKVNLQALAYKRDMEGQRFLLKAPNHLLHLDALTEVFPGAQLIFTHRRLTEVVPSFLSLTDTFHAQYQGVADHNWKRRVLATLRCMMTYGAKFMDEQERSKNRSPLYSLPYTDLITDPIGEMRKLYAYFGLKLTPKTEEAWRSYTSNDPIKKKYGKHKYTMEDFGLTKEDLAGEFMEYIQIMSKRIDPKEIL